MAEADSCKEVPGGQICKVVWLKLMLHWGLKDAEMPDHAVSTGEGWFQREAVCARGSRAGGVGLTNHFGV